MCVGIGDGHCRCGVLEFLKPADDNGRSRDEQRTGKGGRFCDLSCIFTVDASLLSGL